MFEFIKYNRIELREQQGYCIPRGPNFARSRKYTYDLLGSKLRFKAPSQVHLFRPGSESYTPRWFYDNLEVLRTGNDPTKTWGSSLLFSRKYAFYGPWLSGEKIRAAFAISAIAPESTSTHLNFLHPRAFESAIAGFLTAEYGFEEWDKGVARYSAPIDWQPVTDVPVPAVRLLVQNSIDRHRHLYFFFPITKDRIILFAFSYNQYASGTFEERDALISPKPALDLMDSIINSVELVPSPELEKELEEVRKTCPDLSVSEEFPPLQWPATVDKSGLKVIPLNKNQSKKNTG